MNCEKFTRNQSGNILVHCDRSDPNRTYKNQEIDHSKTYLNYNLAPEHKGMTDYEFMKKRYVIAFIISLIVLVLTYKFWLIFTDVKSFSSAGTK